MAGARIDRLSGLVILALRDQRIYQPSGRKLGTRLGFENLLEGSGGLIVLPASEGILGAEGLPLRSLPRLRHGILHAEEGCGRTPGES